MREPAAANQRTRSLITEIGLDIVSRQIKPTTSTEDTDKQSPSKVQEVNLTYEQEPIARQTPLTLPVPQRPLRNGAYEEIPDVLEIPKRLRQAPREIVATQAGEPNKHPGIAGAILRGEEPIAAGQKMHYDGQALNVNTSSPPAADELANIKIVDTSIEGPAGRLNGQRKRELAQLEARSREVREHNLRVSSAR